MLHWISENRAWLFDGLLVAIPVSAVTIYFGRRSRSGGSMRQRGGDKSTNIQLGRDTRINRSDN